MRRGFTLAEVLIAVAVLVVLLGVIFLAASGLIASMQQNKLDTVAQDIYVTAQERLAQVYTDARLEALVAQNADGTTKPGMLVLNEKPADWDQVNEQVPYPDSGLTVYENQTATEAASVLLPAGALSAEVEANHYMIEYSPDYGYIYGVFYSEKGFEPEDMTQWYAAHGNAYREYTRRKGSGVGYYGGEGVEGGKVKMTATSMTVSVDVMNAEELTASIHVRIPAEYKERNARLTVTLVGETSGVEYQLPTKVLDTTAGYFNRAYDLTLDSLRSENTSFRHLAGTSGLLPGENITMSVKAELGAAGNGLFTPDPTLDNASGEAQFNSLFQDVDMDTGTAYISSGRHLENLGNVSANLNLFHAVQTGNIDFENTTPEDGEDTLFWWAETYGERAFTPIVNSRLQSYTGSAVDDGGTVEFYTISGMTIRQGGNAGMFAQLPDGMTVTDVALIGTTADLTSGNVGALAGKAEGTVHLRNVGAYLNREDYAGFTYGTIQTKLRGTNVGGLIGQAQNVSASECYSAQVLQGSFVGGLFGRVEGTMELSRCYSDCYAQGDGGATLAGLAAVCGENSTIDNCYTAGFHTSGYAVSAGFTAGKVARAANSYSAMSLGELSGATYYATVQATADSRSMATVYYAQPEQSSETTTVTYQKAGGETDLSYSALRNGKAPSDKLGSGFFYSSSTANTTAYNLTDGFGLNNYPYPYLRRADGTVLHHYGDWDGNVFEPGTLVYFEEYSGAATGVNYGFYGAGINSLQDNRTVVRDGYALIYTESDVEATNGYGKENAVITVGGKTVQLPALTQNGNKHTVTIKTRTGDTKNVPYYFRELPASVVNDELFAPASSRQFFTYLTVNTPDNQNAPDAYYYVNFHFASTVKQVEKLDENQDAAQSPDAMLTLDDPISIRSPRQLYLLSRYSDVYCGALTSTGSVNFRFSQDMPLNYAAYQWTKAGLDTVTEQSPIGSADKPFAATYDGGSRLISGLNLKAPEGRYDVGLFGYVGSKGILRNIFLANPTVENSAANYTLSFASPLNRANVNAYAGALAANNSGTISNCAVAGYSLNLDSYNSINLYLGGLVGYNNGRILSSSAVSAGITLRANSNNAYVGAFAGANGGQGRISACYGLTSIHATRYTAGTVRVGGFVGSNSGAVTNAYVAAAMTTSNIENSNLDGFANGGSGISGCYYLADGTYKFNKGVYPFAEVKQTAKPVSGLEELYALNIPGFAKAEQSEQAGVTTNSAAGYPGLTSVTAGGKKVHYGDWFTTDVFGDYGMLYWEQETGGTNNGYHFYLVDNEGNKTSTLCTAHDDGGMVSAYGYGYYYLGDTETKPEHYYNVAGVYDASRNLAAETDISGQFAGSYTFRLFNTRSAFADNGEGLYVTGNDVTYATAQYADGTVYSFSPFFGAALVKGDTAITNMEVRSIHQLQFLNWRQSGSKSTESYTAIATPSFGTIYNNRQSNNSKDYYDSYNWTWRTAYATPYYYEKGGQYYQVYTWRSSRNGYYYIGCFTGGEATQSWNEIDYGGSTWTPDGQFYTLSQETVPLTGTTKDLVSSDNYRQFPYLGYATVTGQGSQKKDNAGHKTVFDWTWKQTHDLRMTENVSFTPIAGAATSSDSSGYTAVLYAWFGSSYDGGSYKIQNVGIHSDAFTVGLFGVTAGANMKNVILYSDNGSVIERNAAAASKEGAYALGGLVGVVYDYQGSSNTLENCAIAGYVIADNSKNTQTLGEANVGGLTGICNGSMKNCSAVVDIQVNCTHRGENGNSFTKASWGNFIRVGGLTGATMGSLENCYTGGSITVGEDTLKENLTGTYSSQTGFVSDTDSKARVDVQSSTNVYVAGIGGSGFAQNYKNFTNSGSLNEGNPSFKNCYTYVQFPKLQGTIRSISAIGSVADRYAQGPKVTIKNCYYLNQYARADDLLSQLPAFGYSGSYTTPKSYFQNNGNNLSAMLNGSGVYVNTVLKGNGNSNANGTLEVTAKSLDELSGLTALNGSGTGASNAWGKVTTLENGVVITGKYSFPGNENWLKGQDFPFMTVVTQTSDATGEKVHVHYGRWPMGTGLFSDHANVNLDMLLADSYRKDVELSLYQNYTAQQMSPDGLTLSYDELDENGNPQTGLADSKIVKVEVAQSADGKNLTLTVTGKQEGSVTIRAEYGTYKATVQVTVNAEFSVEAVPVSVQRDGEGKIASVTPLSGNPTVFAGEELSWLLTTRGSETDAQGNRVIVTSVTGDNWSAEPSSLDTNFDTEPVFTSAMRGDGSLIPGMEDGQVLMSFTTLQTAQNRSIQVTAGRLLGADGETAISGTRSVDLTFTVRKIPAQVNVFAKPYGAEENTQTATLFQIVPADAGQAIFYAADKAGTRNVDTLAVPTDTPAGYGEFLGYYLNNTDTQFANSEGVIQTTDAFDENQIFVYPKWQANTYTLGYDLNGVEAELSGGMESYTVADKVTLPNVTPKDEGSLFQGWTLEASDGNWENRTYAPGEEIAPGVYGNVTLKAIWKQRYTIRYYDETGAEYPDTAGSYVGGDGTIALYAPADGETRRFEGWTVMNADEVTGWQGRVNGTLTGTEGYTGHVKLQAVWKNGFTITYLDGEENLGTGSYFDDAPITLKELAGKPGWNFTGWKAAPSEDNTGWTDTTLYRGTLGAENFAGNITLTAQWEEITYTVTYDYGRDDYGISCPVDEAAARSQAYYLGDKLPLANAPVWDGEHTFEGWVVETEDSLWENGKVYEAGAEITTGETLYGDVTLRAKWSVKTYTATLNLNGGTMADTTGWTFAEEQGVYTGTFAKNPGLTLPAVTRRGYTFTTWTLEDGTVPTSEQLQQDVALKAQWSLEEYTVSYVDKDGNPYQDAPAEGETAAQWKSSYHVTDETELKLHTLPEPPTGYTYTGWKVLGEAAGDWQTDTVYPAETVFAPGTMTGSVSLTPNAVAIAYTVVYEDALGTAPAEQTYTIEETPVLPVQETRKNDLGQAMFFAGWKAAEESGSWRAADAMFTAPAGSYGNVKLIAQYTTRTLTLSAASAGVTQPYGVKDGFDGSSFGAYFQLPEGAQGAAQPARTGYAFTGWYTAGDGSGTKVLNADGTIAAAVTGFTARKEDGSFYFDLTGDGTLYAGWTRAYRYLNKLEALPDMTKDENKDKQVVIATADSTTGNLNVVTLGERQWLWTNYYYQVAAREFVRNGATSRYEVSSDAESKILWKPEVNSGGHQFSSAQGTSQWSLCYSNWYGDICGLENGSTFWTYAEGIISCVGQNRNTYYLTISKNGVDKTTDKTKASPITFYEILDGTEVAYN